MTEPFRLGLVGTGLVTERLHLPAALAIPEVSITALVDTNQERAAALAKSHGLQVQLTSDVASALGSMDGALIATPNHTHRAIAEVCMQSGVHVLIEKPLATSAADGMAIEQTAGQTGCIAATGYVMRFLPHVERMRQLLAERHFGAPRRFVWRFGTRGGWSPVSNYTLDRAAVGGGSLVISGTHFLDLSIDWFGYPDRVELWDDALGGPEATASARLFYESDAATGTAGLEGEVLVSKTIALAEGCAVDCQDGVVLFHTAGDGSIRFRPHNQPQVEHLVAPRRPTPPINHFQLQISDFVSSCRTGATPRVPAAVGVKNLQLLEALYAARQPFDEHWYETPSATLRGEA